MRRYKISSSGQYMQLPPQDVTTKETQAIKNFCSNSILFIDMERLASACTSDLERNASMIYSIQNADSFVIAIDIIEHALDGAKSAPKIIQAIYAGFLFFASTVQNEASFERQLPILCNELKTYAKNNGYEVESEDSVYCQPIKVELK